MGLALHASRFCFSPSPTMACSVRILGLALGHCRSAWLGHGLAALRRSVVIFHVAV